MGGNEKRRRGLLALARHAVVDVVDVAPHRGVLIGDATVERLLNLVDVAVHIIEAVVERVLITLLGSDPRLQEEVEAANRGDDESDCDGEGNLVHVFVPNLSVLQVYTKFEGLSSLSSAVRAFLFGSVECFVVIVLVTRHAKHLFEAEIRDRRDQQLLLLLGQHWQTLAKWSQRGAAGVLFPALLLHGDDVLLASDDAAFGDLDRLHERVRRRSKFGFLLCLLDERCFGDTGCELCVSHGKGYVRFLPHAPNALTGALWSGARRCRSRSGRNLARSATSVVGHGERGEVVRQLGE